MKYRYKLYLTLAGTSLASILLALTILYFEAKHRFFQEFRSKVKAIAATAAALVDSELINDIHTIQDETSPSYLKLKRQLRDAREANQRQDIFVRYVYILKPSPKDPNVLIAVADASSTPADMYHVGQIYTDSDAGEIRAHIDQYYADTDYVQDQWGLWLSGYAPIRDEEGNYIATLGIDISAQTINPNFFDLFIDGLYALAASLVLALICGYILSRAITHSLAFICNGVKEIGKGNLGYRVELKTKDEFNDVAHAINEMSKGLEERERLKMNFARYVSHHILEKILESGSLTNLEGERKKVTILFSDIRQFTHLAEILPPEQVVSLLNEYFAAMLEVIFNNQGTLDKFIGDGIMVEFGAPLDDALQEKHAITTAIQMQQQLKKLCEKWEKEGKPTIQMGVG
ncbi:MAG: adenylate/guanylate cyclase domain-containing protein, partial [Anaerolineae bacterium]